MASLVRKYKKARTSIKAMKPEFEKLTNSLMKSFGVEILNSWRQQEDEALRLRGDALCIFAVNRLPGPSQAEKRLELQETELSIGRETGTVAWLADGLNIEDLQYV